MAEIQPLTGLILAGGKSRRLGRDKVCELLSGRSFLEHTASLLGQVCGEVFVSGRDPGGLELDLPWMPDEVPGRGPIGGILTGLRTRQTPILVLACDLPLMTMETLFTLVAAWREKPEDKVMTTFEQRETGFIEALVAVYEPQAAPLLQAALDQSLHKLSAAVPPERRHHIPYSQDQSLPFFNINYPADLALLRQLRSGMNLSGVGSLDSGHGGGRDV